MIKRSEVLKIAESWLDVPWHPSGSDKQSGCNCIGLLIGIAREAKLDSLVSAFQPYIGLSSNPDTMAMLRAFKSNLKRIAPMNAIPCDVLLCSIPIRGRNELTHCVLSMGQGEIIESLELDRQNHTGKVLRRLNPYKIHSAWRVPDIAGDDE